jgi:hypothetical protein
MTENGVVTIARDAFGRFDVIRKKEWFRDGCAWCGRMRPGGLLFVYGTDHDGGGRHWEQKGFCCKGCHDTYHS